MAADNSGPILEAEDLGKSYGLRVAVAGLSLAIQRGECFGLLGPNGAGKTTTLGLLAGLIAPDRGLVRIGGQRVGRRTLEFRKRLGLVPQDFAFYPTLSARDNLCCFGALYGLAGPRLAARISHVLEIAGLIGRESEPVAQFSGGMKRRLNIALGLLHEPDILILDEPTVGVDAQSRGVILETLASLNQSGLTLIYSTHYMEEAQRLCHRVGIMDLGRIMALGSPRELARSLATGIVELELEAPPDASVLARLRDMGATPLGDGEPGLLRLEAPQPERMLAPIFDAVAAAGLPVRGARILEPGLEAVFLKLTGRHLRD